MRIQAKKGLNFYYKTNGITFLKKHVDAKHTVIAKMFQKEINFLLKGRKERQLAKKRAIMFSGSNSKFFPLKNSFKKEDVSSKKIFRRLGSFDYQEQFTNLVCGEHVVEKFNFVFVSKIKFPF